MFLTTDFLALLVFSFVGNAPSHRKYLPDGLNPAKENKQYYYEGHLCDRIWENPPYGIRARFVQCVF